MEIIPKIIKLLFKQSCLLCRQSSDNVTCEYCFRGLVSDLNFNKQTIELDCEYDYYYLLNYSAEVKYLLKKLKFHKDLLVEPIFERLISLWWQNSIGKELDSVDAIAAVPSHKFRYLYRGFNQAELLANRLSQYTNIPPTFTNYERTKYTKPQSKSSKKNRIDQIKGVFKLNKPIQAKHLVVFDDVLTTGSTLKEFIQTVKKESLVDKISIITLVRAG
ncbi:ComF family protein [Allofrancisella guangzhouensis]|uniref:Amidophosphoribosyltransferase n=1 Tax=Allofrancisella guangzhouensis TaxID=594679 RepID=A0A0A8EBF5_9GAMM|nr:phosphoribosyltransferase family protein [Allofrancisella guangzhouensis]AJC49481.1 amidophosphoribosyltransferase [Allofrancisella guangzhouensis]MBK2027983.1 ComF family protein [Allofrancisella guangzhouensis]MBK2043859.1 ComF family protein [Allofrancisella guangzhouensis]MBK2045887.1 ComF family protein [Allofrancisella guangzhouensis]